MSADEVRARPAFDLRLRALAWPVREVPAYEITFLSHPEVEPTNGEAERAIRPAVVNRKVWGRNSLARRCAPSAIRDSLARCSSPPANQVPKLYL